MRANRTRHALSFTAALLATALGGSHVRTLAAPAVATVTASGPSALASRPARWLPPLALRSRDGFEENRGQSDARVRFLSRGSRDTLFLTADEAVLAPKDLPMNRGNAAARPLRMRFANASPRARLEGADSLPAITYYADASDRGTLDGARSYRRVRQPGIYPGVDLEFYRNAGPGTGDDHVEFDLRLAPGANEALLALTFPGADDVSLNADKSLAVQLGDRRVTLRRPYAYQEQDGQRTLVAAEYAIDGTAVRFALGAYDRSRPLTIDPVIEYATYLGSTGDEQLLGAELDEAGNIYIFGRTDNGPTFPLSDLVPAVQSVDPYNCFVSRLAADGSAQASVVFEGLGICNAFGLDGGRVHVALQAIVSDFNGVEQLRTIDFTTPATVTGLKGGPLTQYPGNPSHTEDIVTDGFGTTYLLYHQRLQGSTALQARVMRVSRSGGVERVHDLRVPPDVLRSARAIAVDNFGRVAVVGSTTRTITPTPDAYQAAPPVVASCPENGFLIEVDTTATPTVETYATYVAGSGCDTLVGIVRDPVGTLFVAGRSTSSQLPFGGIGAGGPGGDAFLMRFDRSPTGAPVFATGAAMNLEMGSGSQGVTDPRHPLVRLPNGPLAYTGGAAGASFPLLQPIFDATAAPGFPRFLRLFSPTTFDPIFSTHVDATGEATHAVAAAGTGSTFFDTPFVIAVTETTETGQGTPGLVQPDHAGGADILVRRINVGDVVTNRPPRFDLGADRSIQASSAAGAQFDLSCAWCNIVTDGQLQQLTWTIDGTRYSFNEPFVGRTTLAVGRHLIELVVSDAAGGTSVDTLTLTVTPPGTNRPPIIDLAPGQTVASTSPDGVVLSLVGTVTDPDLDILDLTWTGAGITTKLTVTSPYASGNATVVERLPIGTNVLTLSASDRNGQIVDATVVYVVTSNNTGVGSTVTVTVPDSTIPQVSSFTPGLATLTFSTVTAPGRTTMRTRLDMVPPPPDAPVALQGGSAPLYYDISTTALSTGPVRVCFDTSGMSFADRANARVHRLDLGSWLDVAVAATPAEAAANLLCGQVASIARLGTFAIFTPADEASRVTTIIGNGNPFAPGVPAPGDGGPAAQAPVGIPRTMAFDAPRQVAYISDDRRIRRVDLRTNVISTFAGSGAFVANLATEVNGADALTVDLGASVMAVDRDGHLFIPGINNCSILRVDRDTRRITRVAGAGPDPTSLNCGYDGDGGTAAAAGLAVGGGMAFDGAGNLYFVETIFSTTTLGPGSAVRRIAAGADGLITGGDPGEVIATVAGGGSQWPPQPGDPRQAVIDGSDLAFNSQGDLYIGGTAFVVRITAAPGATTIDGRAGETLSIVAGRALQVNTPYQGDGGPPRLANLHGPRGIDFLPNGDLLIADSSANRIRLVTAGSDGVVNGGADERITTVAGFSHSQPGGLPFSFGGFAGDGYALTTTLSYPMDVVTDPRGGFVIVDTDHNRARRIGPPIANRPPIANAGADQEVVSLGGGAEDVRLDGSASSDPDLDPLTYAWTDGAVALGSGAVLDVTLAPGPHLITLTVTDTAGNRSTDTVLVTVVVQVFESDLRLTVTTPSPVVPGPNDLPLIVTLTNLGPSNAFTTRIIATLPAGLQYVSDDSAGACQWPGGVCDFDNVAAGSSRTVRIVVRPTDIGTFTAGFVASAPVTDPVPANNSASVTITAGVLIAESIHVTDTTVPQTAAQVAIQESIQVTDTTAPTLAVQLGVNEVIAVADAVTAAPQPTMVEVGGTEYQATTLVGTLQPVFVLFPTVTQPGTLIAEIMATPPPPPAGLRFATPVYDVTTTAVYGGPIRLCLESALEPGDRLLHFVNNAWQDITGPSPLATRLCGLSASLSPFAIARADNRPPTAVAGSYPPVEATSTAGAAVTLNGSGSDPDAGDVLTFAWREGSVTLGTTASLTRVFALGVHALTLTVTDRAGASASASTVVTITDTRAPIVTPPASVTIPALGSDGTRVADWPALAAWIAAATAVDVADATPSRLPALWNGQPVGPDTRFPMGSSTVTFRFADDAGNIGTATAVVTVLAGTPRISARLLGTGTLGGLQRYVDLELANSGTGLARNTLVLAVPIVTRGFGLVPVVSPNPVMLGDLRPGETRVVRVVLQVPSTAREVTLFELGGFLTVDGRASAFSDRQVIRP